MAHFSYTVDTSEMANSLDRVSSHVDGVTAAVIAMQTAVIIAEKKSADNVCDNVNKGFYTLIRSQISQKIAKLKSDVDSKFMEMNQQTSTILGIKTRMERDYMMIASRYTKLFNSLNKSLRSRIFELDKFTAHFVNLDIAPLANRLRMLIGTVPINQSESIGSSQVIAASKTKETGNKLITEMHDFIADVNRQKYLVSSILGNKKCEQNYQCYIPVAISESVSKSMHQSQLSYILPKSNDVALQSRLDRSIQSTVFSKTNDLKWADIKKDEKELIKKELIKTVELSNYPDRVKKEITRLFEENNWQNFNSTSI